MEENNNYSYSATDQYFALLDFLGWDEHDLVDCLIEFAKYNMPEIYDKIKDENNLYRMDINDRNHLCDEFMAAFPQMLEELENDQGK